MLAWPLAQRLDLGAGEHQARLDIVGEEILVSRLPVLGDDAAAIILRGRHGPASWLAPRYALLCRSGLHEADPLQGSVDDLLGAVRDGR